MRFSKRSGTDARTPRWRVPALLASAALLGTGITLGVAAPSAQAADTSATLTATGVVSSTYPTGGNVVWIQPGSTLTLNTALAKADLGPALNLVNGLLGSVAGLQAQVDLSSAGVQPTTIGYNASPSVTTPALAKGVYKFTWSFTAVGTNVLGRPASTPLNGNQLAALGIKFNANNSYFGYIVADTQSPCGGAQCIALQTPTLSVAPSLPVVGQLPTITVPGQNVNVPIPSIPGVNAPVTGAPSSTAPTTGGTAGTSSSSPQGYSYTAPACTGPCLVVPRGGGSGGQVGGASDVTLGQIGDAAAGGTSGSSGSGSGSDAALIGSRSGSGGQLAVDRAFSDGGLGDTSGSGVSTSLALAAAAALAGTTVLWLARRRFARG